MKLPWYAFNKKQLFVAFATLLSSVFICAPSVKAQIIPYNSVQSAVNYVTGAASETPYAELSIDAPTNLSYTRLMTELGVRLDWNAVTGASYYEVSLVAPPGAVGELDGIHRINGTTAYYDRISTLQWKVRAVRIKPDGSLLLSSWTTGPDVTAMLPSGSLDPNLPAPQNLRYTRMNNQTQIAFNWDPVAEASYYQLRLVWSDMLSEAPYDITVRATYYLHTSTQGTQWQVRAVREVVPGTKTYSAWTRGPLVSPAYIPTPAVDDSFTPPTGLTYRQLLPDNRVLFSWTAVENASYYQIAFFGPSGYTAPEGSDRMTDLTFVARAVDGMGWKVRAVREKEGGISYSPWVYGNSVRLRDPAYVMPYPRNVVASVRFAQSTPTEDFVDASWDAVPEYIAGTDYRFMYYQVEVAGSTNFVYILGYGNPVIGTSATNSIRMSIPKSGPNYIRVKAFYQGDMGLSSGIYSTPVRVEGIYR